MHFILWNLSFGIFTKFGVFQNQRGFCAIFGMGFKDLILKPSRIAFHVYYNCIFMHLVVCYTCWTACVLVGLDCVEPMMLFTLHVTCSCIFMNMYLTSIYFYISEFFGVFLIVSFFPLSLLFTLVRQCHQNVSLLRPRTVCVLRPPLHLLILPLLLFGFVMRMPERTSRRTFLDEVFIWNAESFWRTSSTLTYPTSFIVGVRN